MPAFILYPLTFIVVLGFLVIVHEFGHYAAAKLLGVRVEVFSVGFGPRLLGLRKGDTDYRVSAIPLGGYVKMSGENPMDERSGDPAEFLSHSRWHRFIIAIAGPAMNVILAIFLLAGIYAFHFATPIYLDQPAVIGYVDDDSAAAKLGLKPGDHIVQIADIKNPTWEQVLPMERLNANLPLSLTVQRGDEIFTSTLTPQPAGTDRMGYAGWDADYPLKVTAIEENMPAAKAGVKLGDVITQVNGVRVRSLSSMLDALQESKGREVTLDYTRNGQPMQVKLTPLLTPIEGRKEPLYRVGIGSDEEKIVRLPLGAAFQRSLADNRRSLVWSGELFKKLIQRQASIRQLEGPLRIGQIAGRVAQKRGLWELGQLTAAISLQLGIFNLLPIPILDGGVILLLLIEGLIRRDISLHVKERIYQVAFVFLVIFASVVIFNDVTKIFPGTKLP